MPSESSRSVSLHALSNDIPFFRTRGYNADILPEIRCLLLVLFERARASCGIEGIQLYLTIINVRDRLLCDWRR